MVVLACAFLAVGADAKPSPNVVVFAAESQPAPGGFNTMLSCCNTDWAIYMGNGEALHGAFVQNGSGGWVKDLVTDAKADARGITYTISPNAYWYWGGRKVPVTYRDFVYTLQNIDDPANDVAGRTGYANLDPTKVAHVGDRRVTLFWRRTNCSTDYPCGPFAAWQALFSSLYPSFALEGLDFNKIWTNCICGSDGKPVADGPFYLASYTRGQGAVLKANPYYHDRARLDEVDFKLLADDALEREAIRDGQVDAIYPSVAPSFLALKAVKGLDVLVAPTYALEFLDLREGTKSRSNRLLGAPWMRRAIALALDRRRMIDAVYGPASELRPLDSLVYFPGQAGYRPDFVRWNYAPAKALALLAKHCTGGPSAPDPATRKTWRCDGLPATFRYTWPLASDRTTIAGIAKANLRAVGIDVVDGPLGLDALSNAIVSGDFDLAQYLYVTDGNPGDWFDIYGCSRAANYGGYCSHAVDRLFTAATAELDPAKRAAFFGRVDALLAADVPAVPLFQKPGMVVRKSGLLGVGPTAGLAGPFWNIQDWHWKR
jgi:peptide/nickel transport system substrate-binding protein